MTFGDLTAPQRKPPVDRSNASETSNSMNPNHTSVAHGQAPSSVVAGRPAMKPTFIQHPDQQHTRTQQQQQQQLKSDAVQLSHLPPLRHFVQHPHAQHHQHQHQHHHPAAAHRLNLGHVGAAVKDNRFVRALSETTMAFCDTTTLHGVKYMVQDLEELGSAYTSQRRLRKLISLTFWCVACVMGAVFAIVLMGLVWNRFQTTPTITTVETNNYPIWNVPFPAVTICNINKVYAPAAKNIMAKLIEKGLVRESVVEFLENLAKLITPEYIDALYLKTFQHLEEMGYTTDRLMFELMQPCNHMIKSCAWLGKTVPCDTLFRVAKSSEGYCCSFNYKALKDSLEINAASDTVNDQLNNPIYRVTGSGENVGLNVRIDIERDEYVAYSKSFYGAKVLIHDPEDFPQSSVTTAIAQPSYDVMMAVLPSVIVSEPGIRGLAQQQRNCLFEDEQKLRTTNKYSFQSCMNECTVDTILSKCDCVPFYYPESDIRVYAKRYRQCSLHDVKCLRDNRHIFSSLQPPITVDFLNETNLGMQCSCLPSCSEHRYEVQTILSKRSIDDHLNSTSINDNVVDVERATTVEVHFKDLTCIKYRRDMYMTWDGLFASFGGIFGLCLGGSVISLVEMLYYFTLRFYARLQALQTGHQPATRPGSIAEPKGRSSVRTIVLPKLMRTKAGGGSSTTSTNRLQLFDAVNRTEQGLPEQQRHPGEKQTNTFTTINERPDARPALRQYLK